MALDRASIWRILFVVGGIGYFAGGFQHPRGMMVDMLADPVWIPAHATMFVALLLLVLGLLLRRREEATSPALNRWLALASAATALEAIEMAVHTLAYLDAEALAVQGSTPTLMTHIWLATVFHPLFAVALIGLILVGQRERSLGSRWFGWVGMIGAVANGIAVPLVVFLQLGWAVLLFPLAAFTLSLWFLLAGVWPAKTTLG
jgi:hypothetical protein